MPILYGLLILLLLAAAAAAVAAGIAQAVDCSQYGLYNKEQ